MSAQAAVIHSIIDLLPWHNESDQRSCHAAADEAFADSPVDEPADPVSIPVETAPVS